jgi:hypothetical protein
VLSIPELNIGSIDAVTYKARGEKEFFARIFLRDSFLETILESKRYFLIGEKGTGKTAYAVLLANSEYNNTASSVRSLNSTDYDKFIRLREQKFKYVTSYSDAWKVILLLLACDHIKAADVGEGILAKFGKFRALQDAIDEYYLSAFSPEVVNALEFVENAEAAASLVSKYAKLEAKIQETSKEQDHGFQVNLLYLERQFRDAIGSIRLAKNHILFIDGIDIRPEEISYLTYIECLRGLAQATWYLNTEFFENIRGSKGRIKIVLLLRPDILNQLGYQNLNAKVRDNGLVLDWRTAYRDYRGSKIFRLIDGILGKQQSIDVASNPGRTWDHYFPYELANLRLAGQTDNPFIGFLRYSFYRPRDVIQYVLMMQEYAKLHQHNKDSFAKSTFENCQASYSDYLLGEVRDHLGFYYTTVDFDELTGFFKYIKGASRFSWAEFEAAYNRYKSGRKAVTLTALNEGPESFLQFLYSLNVIGYDEISVNQDEVFTHWCFWDRTPVTLNPKVPAGLPPVPKGRGGPYYVHAGLMRALKVGSIPKYSR